MPRAKYTSGNANDQRHLLQQSFMEFQNLYEKESPQAAFNYLHSVGAPSTVVEVANQMHEAFKAREVEVYLSKYQDGFRLYDEDDSKTRVAKQTALSDFFVRLQNSRDVDRELEKSFKQIQTNPELAGDSKFKQLLADVAKDIKPKSTFSGPGLDVGGSDDLIFTARNTAGKKLESVLSEQERNRILEEYSRKFYLMIADPAKIKAAEKKINVDFNVACVKECQQPLAVILAKSDIDMLKREKEKLKVAVSGAQERIIRKCKKLGDSSVNELVEQYQNEFELKKGTNGVPLDDEKNRKLAERVTNKVKENAYGARSRKVDIVRELISDLKSKTVGESFSKAKSRARDANDFSLEEMLNKHEPMLSKAPESIELKTKVLSDAYALYLPESNVNEFERTTRKEVEFLHKNGFKNIDGDYCNSIHHCVEKDVKAGILNLAVNKLQLDQFMTLTDKIGQSVNPEIGSQILRAIEMEKLSIDSQLRNTSLTTVMFAPSPAIDKNLNQIVTSAN